MVEDKLRLTMLKFRRSETELDWNYPFDFCGSIYRLQSVIDVISKFQSASKILKPNTFEFEGNKAIKLNLLAKSHPYSLCMNRPCMTVITVNRVQDIYKNPIYKLDTLNENEESKEVKSE